MAKVERAPKPPVEAPKTQFRKGQSGNPKGRPKGSKNKTTLVKEQIEAGLVAEAEQDALDVYRKTVELAKQGDTTCLKLLMDRFWPAGRKEDKAEKSPGGVNIIIKGLEVEEPKAIEGEVVRDGD